MRYGVIVDIGLYFGIEGIELGTGVEHGVAHEIDNETAGAIGRHGSKDF